MVNDWFGGRVVGGIDESIGGGWIRVFAVEGAFLDEV